MLYRGTGSEALYYLFGNLKRKKMILIDVLLFYPKPISQLKFSIIDN